MNIQTSDALSTSGQGNAVSLFHRAVNGIAAYRDFLRDRGFDPKSVSSFQDFQQVPATSKENYIERYKLEELVWDGTLCNATIILSSSGTSGNPYYWPCSDEELKRSMKVYETVFRKGFEVGSKYQKTLLIICFGMGTWIAGSYTTAASMLLRLEGLPLTIVTPGFNRQEALRLMDHLGKSFDQVILAGIPSFIKDLLDEWSPLRPNNYPKTRVLLAGEGFPELWRDYVAREIRGESKDVISLLGSADAGLIGFESWRSIKLRKAIEKDRSLRHALVANERIPGILHFDPNYRFLESSSSGQLLITADRSLPLIRYNTMDIGGILPSNAFPNESPIQQNELDIVSLPFVYLFGRGSKSATLYGANIYAEWVQEFLLEQLLINCTSGRFCLETVWLPNHTQQLNVRLELAQDFKPVGDEPQIWAQSLAGLLRLRSTEYARISEEFGQRAFPNVTLHGYGCPNYFPEVQRKYS